MKIAISTTLAALIALQPFAPALGSSFSRPPVDAIVRTAALDCQAIGQKKADEVGGKLAKAKPIVRKGQLTCLVVVVVPSKNGDRPHRAQFYLSN